MEILDRVVDRFQEDPPERPYEYLRCGVSLDLEYYICPDCGSFSIDRCSAFR